MISVIIPFKNRDNYRLQRTIDFIKNYEFIKEIIVVDYGSENPPKVKDAKIIRYDKNPIWNKSHALNYGIKKSSQPFIMTLDVDILIPKETMTEIPKYLDEDCFLFSTHVKRINTKDVGEWGKSWPWYENRGKWSQLNSKANGGFQLFSKKWIYKVKGYDEDFILFGGMDNDLWNRAHLDGLSMVNLNKPIYHQEHEKRKEDNFDLGSREKAVFIRKQKSFYVRQKVEEEKIISEDPWGEEKPNQDKFIDLWKNWDREIKKIQKKRKGHIKKIKEFIREKKIPISSMNVEWING